MKAIFNREWQSYFLSPIGYIFTGVFIALCSFFFVNGAIMYQSADLNLVFSNISIVYLFLVSMLTMGLFSGERSRKTDQLLLTSPVEVSHIVMGKYFSAMAVFGTTLILTIIYPVVLNLYGSPSQSEMIGIYIGFILLWGSIIAIGTFISSLMENQIMAGVTTFGVLLIIYCLPSLVANISSEFLANIVSWFSVTERYYEFQGGILDIANIIYYLSVIFICLFLTTQAIKGRQHSDSRVRINNLVVTAATVAAVIIVNMIVSMIGTKVPLQIDLTRDDVYEFSEQTKEVLKDLDGEVKVYAIYPEGADGGTEVETIKQYLSRYSRLSDNISVEYRDPYEDPAFVRSYGDDVEVGALIVAKGDKSRVLQYSQLFCRNQYTGSVSIDAEKLLTSAIRYVSGKSREANAYFVKGHGEYAGVESQLGQVLETEGYVVGDIMISTDGIPEDATVLVCLSPSVDFTQEERDAIDKYLLNGGSMAFVFTAGAPSLERVSSYLSEWGITLNNDFVIEKDTKRSLRSQTGVPVPAPLMEEHPITEKILSDEILTVTPSASSVTLNSDNLQRAKVTALLKTTDKSYGIRDISSGSVEKSEGDFEGPLAVAALSEKSKDENGGKIFVITSLQAIEGGILTDASYSNGDFVLNSVSYLSGKGDALNIRPKVISASALVMTEKEIKTVVVLVQYIFPIVVILFGLIIWLRRRFL